MSKKSASEIRSKFQSRLESIGFLPNVYEFISLEQLRKEWKSGATEFAPKTTKETRSEKQINEETVIFVFYGISFSRGALRLNTLVGAENLILRNLAKASTNLQIFRSNGRFCQIYLESYGVPAFIGSIDDCAIDSWIETAVNAIDERVTPDLSNYNTTKKIENLLKTYLKNKSSTNLYIDEADVILELLSRGGGY